VVERQLHMQRPPSPFMSQGSVGGSISVPAGAEGDVRPPSDGRWTSQGRYDRATSGGYGNFGGWGPPVTLSGKRSAKPSAQFSLHQSQQSIASDAIGQVRARTDSEARASSG